MQLRPHTLILGLCILAPAASAELLVQVDSTFSNAFVDYNGVTNLPSDVLGRSIGRLTRVDVGADPVDVEQIGIHAHVNDAGSRLRYAIFGAANGSAPLFVSDPVTLAESPEAQIRLGDWFDSPVFDPVRLEADTTYYIGGVVAEPIADAASVGNVVFHHNASAVAVSGTGLFLPVGDGAEGVGPFASPGIANAAGTSFNNQTAIRVYGTVVPEPASAALLAAGATLLARRRRA